MPRFNEIKPSGETAKSIRQQFEQEGEISMDDAKQLLLEVERLTPRYPCAAPTLNAVLANVLGMILVRMDDDGELRKCVLNEVDWTEAKIARDNFDGWLEEYSKADANWRATKRAAALAKLTADEIRLLGLEELASMANARDADKQGD